MNILFIAPLRKISLHYSFYEVIIDSILESKHNLIDNWLKDIDKKNYTFSDQQFREEFFYERFRDNLELTDLLICDCSVLSKTLIRQIAMALLAEKKVICVLKKSRIKATDFIEFIKDPNLKIFYYNNRKDLKKVISAALTD